MRKFYSKGYGIILVSKEEEIGIVKAEIKEMDAFEYDYLPDNLIRVMPPTGSILLEYNGKFDDLDIDILAIRLWRKGIHILAISSSGDDSIYIQSTENNKDPR